MRCSVPLFFALAAAQTTVTITTTSTANTAVVTDSIAANTTSTITTTVAGSSCALTPVVTVTATVVDTGTLTSTTTVIYTPTTTATATSTPACLTPSTCSNSGLLYAKYNAPAATACSVKDSVYCSNYQPADYKSVTPVYTGVTNFVGGFATFNWQGSFSVYNRTIPARYFILDHKGYFFAPQTGTYTFKFPLCDDKCWLWLGSNAYSGWNASNANAYMVYTNLKGHNVLNYTLTQNTYTPLRMYFTQGNGPVNLTMTITGPDGTVLSQPNDASTYLVQQSCDGTAPAFPLWGQET